MKLYYKPGACSLAAHIVLNEAGASYELEKVDTAAGLTETGAAYAGVNPRGYVPAIELDDGTVITENAAILQFLADRFDQPGLAPPTGSMARVRLQEDLSFLSSEVHKAFSPFFAGRDLSPEEKAAALATLSHKIGHLEKMLSGKGGSLNGPEFSVSDAYAFVILNWSKFIGLSLEAWPNTARFVERHAMRPSVQKALREEGLLQ